MRHFEVTYEVVDVEGPIEAFARDLLLEQTFETPADVVARYPRLEEMGSGEVAAIEDVGEGHFRITLSLPELNALDASQLLNATFGNAAIHRGIRLVDFEPSVGMLDLLGGPTLGLEGIRAAMQIPTRPLTATALKPVGLPLDDIAALCRDFAESGIDIIKDDHYLSDQPGCRFEERVRRCSAIAAEATERLGRPIWYVPNISGRPAEVTSRIALAVEHGARCVMLAPMAVGLPLMNEISRDHPDVAILAHPSFSPVTAIAPEVLWGRLFRIFGADAIIFVNAGGRFAYSEETCRLIAATITAPLPGCRPALPVPAGGISLDAVQGAIRAYGNDSMLLVGGSLLRARDRRDAARRFVASVEEFALLTS